MSEEKVIKKKTDHDLTTEHSIKIDNLCKIVKNFDNKFDKYIDKVDKRNERIHKRIDKVSNSFVDKITLRWIFGIVITVILLMTAAIGANQIKSNKNENSIINNNEQIKLNAEGIKDLKELIEKRLWKLIGENDEND